MLRVVSKKSMANKHWHEDHQVVHLPSACLNDFGVCHEDAKMRFLKSECCIQMLMLLESGHEYTRPCECRCGPGKQKCGDLELWEDLIFVTNRRTQSTRLQDKTWRLRSLALWKKIEFQTANLQAQPLSLGCGITTTGFQCQIILKTCMHFIRVRGLNSERSILTI